MIEKHINLKTRGLPIRIDVVQGTNAIPIKLTLTDYDIPVGAEARIYVRKPSNTEVYNNCTIDNNSVIVQPTTQMYAEVGRLKAQIQLIAGDGVAASFVFCIDVAENLVSSSAVESCNEFGILDTLINEAREMIATLGGLKPHAFAAPIQNLATTVAGSALDATMGKKLQDGIDTLNSGLENLTKDIIKVGSDETTGTSKWFKVCSQTCSGYGNTNIMFAVTRGYTYPSDNGQGILSIQIRSDGTSIQIADFEWLANSGLNINHFIIVVSGMKWTLYTYNTRQYNHIKFEALSSGDIRGNKYTWPLEYTSPNLTPEAVAPTPTATSKNITLPASNVSVSSISETSATSAQAVFSELYSNLQAKDETLSPFDTSTTISFGQCKIYPGGLVNIIFDLKSSNQYESSSSNWYNFATASIKPKNITYFTAVHRNSLVAIGRIDLQGNIAIKFGANGYVADSRIQGNFCFELLK